MRTTKRFTPQVLRRFAREGRGQGTYEDYQAWHRVTRSDPASRGRSHILHWKDLSIDLLSDKERVVFLVASMVPGLIDVRAQFPLALTCGPHEIEAYGGSRLPTTVPGIKEIAQSLGVRPPVITAEDEREDWISTTDLLLTVKDAAGKMALLAIAFKLSKELPARRKRELLRLEQEYWRQRDVTWLLLTEELIDTALAECLERVWYWALHQPLEESIRRAAANTIRALEGRSLSYMLEHLAQRFGSKDIAQHAFWQAVWGGLAPIELRRGWRPHLPVTLLTSEVFWGLNPIVARRSAWIS